MYDLESFKKCGPRIIILKLLGKISFIKLELIQYTSVNIHLCQEKNHPAEKWQSKIKRREYNVGHFPHLNFRF